MGYYMDQHDCNFTIKHENIQKAWDALIKLFKTEKESTHDSYRYGYSWIDTESVLKAESFKDAMAEARWDIYYDNKCKNVEGIYFNGEKYSGDEVIILGAIAPYVENGSYIEMRGEDGEMWRWVFNNRNIEEKYPKIIWE